MVGNKGGSNLSLASSFGLLNRDKSLSENVDITSAALQLRGIYVFTSGILFSLIPGVGFKTVLEQLNNIN